MGFGGVTGCVAGGYMTQYSHPKYTFLIVSVMGMLISLIGLLLTEDSEKEATELNAETQKEPDFWVSL